MLAVLLIEAVLEPAFVGQLEMVGVSKVTVETSIRTRRFLNFSIICTELQLPEND